MGINFFDVQAPNTTTLLKFRPLLKKHNICTAFFDAMTNTFEQHGHMMQGGTIVEATFSSSPSSTKNERKSATLKCIKPRKAMWHFRMKCHSGVDVDGGYIHSMETAAANVHDITVAPQLIREDDDVIYRDSD